MWSFVSGFFYLPWFLFFWKFIHVVVCVSTSSLISFISHPWYPTSAQHTVGTQGLRTLTRGPEDLPKWEQLRTKEIPVTPQAARWLRCMPTANDVNIAICYQTHDCIPALNFRGVLQIHLLILNYSALIPTSSCFWKPWWLIALQLTLFLQQWMAWTSWRKMIFQIQIVSNYYHRIVSLAPLVYPLFLIYLGDYIFRCMHVYSCYLI